MTREDKKDAVITFTTLTLFVVWQIYHHPWLLYVITSLFISYQAAIGFYLFWFFVVFMVIRWWDKNKARMWNELDARFPRRK